MAITLWNEHSASHANRFNVVYRYLCSAPVENEKERKKEKENGAKGKRKQYPP